MTQNIQKIVDKSNNNKKDEGEETWIKTPEIIRKKRRRKLP